LFINDEKTQSGNSAGKENGVMSMMEWNQRIAPRLQDLEYCGSQIARYGRHIQNSVATLPIRPAWETKAHDALCTAEKELQIALAHVRTMKEQYEQIPVMSEAAE
jgi:hypothetical protein